MSRVQQALQKLGSISGVPVKAIEQYILTGDQKVLSQIPPAKPGMWSWDGNALAGTLGRLPEWTDEDRRSLHVLFARFQG